MELEARFPRQQTAVICMQVVWEECSGEQPLWVREASGKEETLNGGIVATAPQWGPPRALELGWPFGVLN